MRMQADTVAGLKTFPSCLSQLEYTEYTDKLQSELVLKNNIYPMVKITDFDIQYLLTKTNENLLKKF